MKVHWTGTAIEHLSAIHKYIAQNSNQYAKRVVDRLTKRSQQIVGFPLSVRIVPELSVEQIHGKGYVFENILFKSLRAFLITWIF